MAQDEPKWLPHNGQGAPDLPPGTCVQVRCRNWETEGEDPNEYDPFIDLVWENWDHAPHLDIVAYRVAHHGK